MRKTNFLIMLLSLVIISTTVIAQHNSLHVRGEKRGSLPKFEENKNMNFLHNYNAKVNPSTNKGKSNWEADYTERFAVADYNVEVKFGDIVQDDEGNIIYTCTNGRQDFGFKCQVVKVDAEGTQLWAKDYSDYIYSAGKKLVVDSENNIYVLGDISTDGINHELFVIKYNNQGELQWENYFSEDYFATCFAKDFLIDTEGYLWLVAEITSGLDGRSLYVSKIDNSGVEQWNIEIENSDPMATIEYVKSYLNSSNQIFINTNYNNLYTSYIIGSTGDILSENNQSFKCIDVEYKGNNFFILGQQQVPSLMRFKKIDETGTLIWEDSISSVNTVFVGDIFVNDNGNVFSIYQDQWAVTTFTFLSSDGAITNNETIAPEIFSYHFGFNIFANNDNSFFIAGWGSLIEDYSNKAAVLSFTSDAELDTITLIVPDTINTETKAYDFAFFNEKVIICGNQGNWNVEPGFDLFISEMDVDNSLSWTSIVPREKTANFLVWGSDMDENSNTYFATNSAGKYKIVKQNSQGEIEWVTEYFEEYKYLGCADIKYMSDNSVVAVGYKENPDYTVSGVLTKTNLDGSTVWEVILDQGDWNALQVAYIEEDNDGNIIIASAGYGADWVGRIMVSKMDQNGEIIWNYINMETSNSSSVYHLTVAPNNDIIISGTETTPDWYYDLYAERINTDGELIWEYHGNIGNYDLFSEAVSDANGNTYLVGETGATGFVYKLNETGELVWENVMETEYGFYWSVVINQEDYNSVYCSGTIIDEDMLKPIVTSLDSMGNINWQTIAPAEYNSNGTFLLNDTEYLYQIVTTYNPLTEDYVAGFKRFNHQGGLDAVSEEIISRGGANYASLSGVHQNSDKVGFVVQSSGFAEYGSIGISSLYSKPGIGVGSQEFIVEKSLTKVYPNPASDFITVESMDNSVIEIYDLAGKVLIKASVNSNIESINVRDIESGIYLMRISNESGSSSHKIIISHK